MIWCTIVKRLLSWSETGVYCHATRAKKENKHDFHICHSPNSIQHMRGFRLRVSDGHATISPPEPSLHLSKNVFQPLSWSKRTYSYAGAFTGSRFYFWDLFLESLGNFSGPKSSSTGPSSHTHLFY